jgi:hypothetical protein
VVVIYFDDLSAKTICPAIKGYRTHYYDNCECSPILTPVNSIICFSLTACLARSFYNPPEVSLCDICNGADECKNDCEESEINVVAENAKMLNPSSA